jgi:hypothetical protein
LSDASTLASRFEARHAIDVRGELRRQQSLERDVPPEARVARTPDFAHATLARVDP